MSRRAVGSAFCAMSAFLFAIYHLALAIRTIPEGWTIRPSENLLIASIVSLSIGIFYLIWGEVTAGK